MRSFDFTRAVYTELGTDPNEKIQKIPRIVALFFATLAELWMRVFGGHTEFNQFNIQFATAAQTYKVDKVRRLLGYQPEISMADGIKRMVEEKERQQGTTR